MPEDNKERFVAVDIGFHQNIEIGQDEEGKHYIALEVNQFKLSVSFSDITIMRQVARLADIYLKNHDKSP